MKYLRKIFENTSGEVRYVEDCFMDISENPNFNVELISMLDLFDEIEVAIDRIKDRFENAEIKVETNRREEINILISIRK